MPILAVSITTGKGIPKKRDLDKSKKESDFYALGREAAELERKREEADAKTTTADLYSSIIMAQAKMMMNTVMMDIARLLAEIRVQNELSKAILQQLGINNFPSLTPFNAQPPNAPFPPLPIGQEGGGSSQPPFPPLPTGAEQGGMTTAGGGMPTEMTGSGGVGPGGGLPSMPPGGGGIPPMG
jgi:hypothetical protein